LRGKVKVGEGKSSELSARQEWMEDFREEAMNGSERSMNSKEKTGGWERNHNAEEQLTSRKSAVVGEERAMMVKEA
jgi:hypothetical protein